MSARNLQLPPMCSNGKVVKVNGGLMTAGISAFKTQAKITGLLAIGRGVCSA